MMKSTFLLPILYLVLAVLSFLITTSGQGSKSNIVIQIAAAPSIATAQINGHGASIGNNNIKTPGTYNVTVSAQGFSPQTQIVKVSLGQTLYVGFVLKSDSSSTSSWYDDHPSDNTLNNTIGSKLSDNYSGASQADNPFLNQLPIVYGDGRGGLVNISQGTPLTPNGPPAVYVSASNTDSRQSVLSYIRNQGYDPAVMDIVFSQQNIPLGVGGE